MSDGGHPQVRLLTNFSGNQDENPLSRRIALVPASVRSRVMQVADDIVQGRIRVPENYDGAEFATPG